MNRKQRAAATLAAKALRVALDGDWDDVFPIIQSISNRYGGSGLYVMLCAWCDLYLIHAYGGPVPPDMGGVVRLMGPEAPCGHPECGDGDMPHEALWMARVIEARAALDQQAFDKQLIDARFVERRNEYVTCLFRSIVETMARMPAGFARYPGGIASLN
jgi:hypothetical protein